jgi:checkpoint serine/threonine-protein kinase
MFGKDAVPDSVMQEGHERYRRLVDEAEKREREGDEMQDGVSDLLDAYQQ